MWLPWIPTNERMPERDQRVLIYATERPGYPAGIMLTSRGLFGWLSKTPDEYVTHWMQLPDTPCSTTPEEIKCCSSAKP